MMFSVHSLAAARSLGGRSGRKVVVASWCGSIQRHSSSSVCGETNTTTAFSSSSSTSRLGLICLAAATTASAAAAATKNQGQEYPNSTTTTIIKSSSSLAYCEAASVASNGNENTIANNITDDTNTSAESSNIPLWPNDGETFHEDVDILVDEILKDPTINLSLIPDCMESKLYRSTIILTLNIVYCELSKLDGLPILAHRLQLSRSQQYRHIAIADIIQRSSNQINDERLEQIADRLLANPSVNATLIPDAIERQVYVNCLKVIFRVLLLLANSFTITICGHDIKFVLEPSTLEEIALEQSTTAATAKSSTTKVDMELLHEFAAGVSGIEDEGEGSAGSSSSWWDRLRFGNEFNKRLHASLYGLILGIVDDIMANTKIKILSDDINLDMIAAATVAAEEEGEDVDVTTKMKKKKDADNEDSLEEAKGGTDDNKTVSVGSFAAASFVAGVGVGVASMAVLSTRQQR